MNKREALKYRVPTFRVKMLRDNRGGDMLTLTAPMAADIFAHNIGDIPYEEVWMLTVNGASKVSGAIKIGQGGAHGCALMPKDILIPAVASLASGIVLGHNHPSGDCTPSREDIELTSNVVQAGSVLGIPLLDHIVVSYGEYGMNYCSMFEKGLM